MERWLLPERINLADEYINVKERFGHWKDAGLMLTGEAVRTFTVMFLKMWDLTEKTENMALYLKQDLQPASEKHMQRAAVS